MANDIRVQEGIGTQNQATLLADYLFNAGATVVPLRPIGHQLNEIVLDNTNNPITTYSKIPILGTDPRETAKTPRFNSDLGTVEFCVVDAGCEPAESDPIWHTADTATVFFGDAGETPYRFAETTTTETETAFARYTPNIQESGFYPVYAWSPYGDNRAPDQTYRIQHTGGATEVEVNHQRVGNGYVYLGTYFFETGENVATGSVVISNQSDTPGSVVVADAIRFGNGLGDIVRKSGKKPSQLGREDETALYWIEAQVGQGIENNNTVLPSTDSLNYYRLEAGRFGNFVSYGLKSFTHEGVT